MNTIAHTSTTTAGPNGVHPHALPLVITQGDPAIFVQRPISAILLAVTGFVVLLIILPAFRKTREEAFVE